LLLDKVDWEKYIKEGFSGGFRAEEGKAADE
jgi:hypothetical protein